MTSKDPFSSGFMERCWRPRLITQVLIEHPLFVVAL